MDKVRWAKVVLCLVVGILAALGLAGLSSALTPKGLFMNAVKPSSAAEELAKIQLVNYELGQSPGNMVSTTFLVRNDSDENIKNVQLLCEFFDGEGRYLDRAKWLMNTIITAGETKSLESTERKFIHSKRVSYQCAVHGFQVVRPAFYSLHGKSGRHDSHAGPLHDEAQPSTLVHDEPGQGKDHEEKQH